MSILINDNELIMGLKRTQAVLLKKRQHTTNEGVAEDIKHDLNCINLILSHFAQFHSLEDVQRSLARRVINRANEKDKVTR